MDEGKLDADLVRLFIESEVYARFKAMLVDESEAEDLEGYV